MPGEPATSQLELVRFAGKHSVRRGEEFTETIRRGKCPLHRRYSTDYAGTNSFGWIFKCSGFTTAQVKRLRANLEPGSLEQPVAGVSHYFVAMPL